MLLEREPEAIAELCRWWSATPVTGDALTRDEAHRVWGLRLALRAPARDRFDRLPVAIQTQLAELYAEVWSLDAVDLGGHAAPAPLSILSSRTGAEAREHEHV